MATGKYQELLELKRNAAIEFKAGPAACLLCPDMGGRVFAECCGVSPHRIDLACAAKPTSAFNNYGGNNFWPAPEGGKFGFNYSPSRNEWYVQPAINEQPFRVVRRDQHSAVISKDVKLVNRAGTTLEARMQREFRLLSEPPEILSFRPLKGLLSSSIFNSDETMLAFELETVGAANIRAGRLAGAELVSATAFAVLENPAQVDE